MARFTASQSDSRVADESRGLTAKHQRQKWHRLAYQHETCRAKTRGFPWMSVCRSVWVQTKVCREQNCPASQATRPAMDRVQANARTPDPRAVRLSQLHLQTKRSSPTCLFRRVPSAAVLHSSSACWNRLTIPFGIGCVSCCGQHGSSCSEPLVFEWRHAVDLDNTFGY